MTEKEQQALDKKIEVLEKKVSKVHVEYEAMLEELNNLLIQLYPERQEATIKERLWNAYKKSTLHYIPVAMRISDKDSHTWLEWVDLIDENCIATNGAKGVQNDWIKRAKDDITSILNQKLTVLSLGLITNDEIQNLFEIRTSLTALETYFIINPVDGGFDTDYLKMAGKDLFKNIQETRIVAFLNDEKFELKNEEKENA